VSRLILESVLCVVVVVGVVIPLSLHSPTLIFVRLLGPGPSMHRFTGINGNIFRWGSHPSGDVFKKKRNLKFARLFWSLPTLNVGAVIAT
jgi:hypothetical protein